MFSEADVSSIAMASQCLLPQQVAHLCCDSLARQRHTLVFTIAVTSYSATVNWYCNNLIAPLCCGQPCGRDSGSCAPCTRALAR